MPLSSANVNSLASDGAKGRGSDHPPVHPLRRHRHPPVHPLRRHRHRLHPLGEVYPDAGNAVASGEGSEAVARHPTAGLGDLGAPKQVRLRLHLRCHLRLGSIFVAIFRLGCILGAILGQQYSIGIAATAATATAFLLRRKLESREEKLKIFLQHPIRATNDERAKARVCQVQST